MKYLVIGILLLTQGIAYASEYTNEQYANAIYKAEGGERATYQYGIRSLKYENRSNRALSRHEWARMICINTIRNNKRRYSEYGYKTYDTFIDFLGSRYCPTKGKDLSKAEKRLNGNWISNVTYFLQKGCEPC